MNKETKSYLTAHISVFLFGLTGLFGKFIALNPLIIVFGRVSIAALFMFVWLIVSKEPLKLNNNAEYKKLLFMGILLALHWTSFFASIQLSNVAIGLLTFSTFPVFVSFFKPLFFHKKIAKKEVLFGFITIIGILFVVPLKDIFSDTMIGSIIGIISGALYAIFTIYNEKLVQTYSGKKVAFYEQAVATIFLLPSLFIIKPVVTTKDIVLLVLLGTVFTGVAHTMFISSLKHISAYMASIITMLEPIYSIILAYLVLGEELNIKIAIGGIIILSTVAFISMDNLKAKDKHISNAL